MVNTKVTLSGWELDNPVIPASGTFNFGKEFAEFYDINMLGTFSFKGTTREPRFGNPTPRIAETPMGMINSVGLQNPGIHAVLDHELPCRFGRLSGFVQRVLHRVLEFLFLHGLGIFRTVFLDDDDFLFHDTYLLKSCDPYESIMGAEKVLFSATNSSNVAITSATDGLGSTWSSTYPITYAAMTVVGLTFPFSKRDMD